MSSSHNFTYLRSRQVQSLEELADELASRAERVLEELGGHLRKAAASLRESAATVPSRIPGHQIVSYEHPVAGYFIASISDFRQMTVHLRQAIGKPAHYSLAERVYFETAIALPVVAQAMDHFNGQTTEYLGDGTLTLFAVEEGDAESVCEAAYKAAVSAVEAVLWIVNPRIARANLPELSLGIGIGMSRALVSAIGLSGQLVPNAFGECVFHAAKLSKWGSNEIYADKTFELHYPSVEGGRIRFRTRQQDDIEGFLISKELPG